MFVPAEMKRLLGVGIVAALLSKFSLIVSALLVVAMLLTKVSPICWAVSFLLCSFSILACLASYLEAKRISGSVMVFGKFIMFFWLLYLAATLSAALAFKRLTRIAILAVLVLGVWGIRRHMPLLYFGLSDWLKTSLRGTTPYNSEHKP